MPKPTVPGRRPRRATPTGSGVGTAAEAGEADGQPAAVHRAGCGVGRVVGYRTGAEARVDEQGLGAQPDEETGVGNKPRGVVEMSVRTLQAVTG
ncbi:MULTISPECIES: hypothetical protein [unclassified Streptomyces]|uniref:hypothetical protein n=1 Tax=unclassified Streptomyces TaxID=2593676 RepID=UPI00035E78DA|nr:MULTISPECIES: hypothetical protein [unclassified Streptomyces]MYY03471.1 hypothetical protein [Streptomyces sp. SID4913]